MYQIDLSSPKKAFFIGIGGISMSGFAKFLKDKGFEITGSDRTKSEITQELESLDIKVYYQQVAENITDEYDFVVYTAAIHPDHPEFIKAEELNLPMMERAVLVGQIMKNHKVPIAIAGTHGKTTTTSITSNLLNAANLNPTISVGGILPSIGGNMQIGDGNYMVTEACEYTNSFLKFFPKISIILNIEEDHMDFFHNIDEIRESFKKFAMLLPEDGTLIINHDIDKLDEFLSGLKCNVITFSASNHEADYSADNITYDEMSHPTFDVLVNNKLKYNLKVSLTGSHNVSNTLAALAVADLLNIDEDVIKETLLQNISSKRRFEKIGTYNGANIIDDYAHHPTEIKATLEAALKCEYNRLWVVFQPHTYTRTKAFLNDFASALSLADKVVLADIYAAREKDPGDISSKDIADIINNGANADEKAIYLGDFDSIEKFFQKNLQPNDMLITMGAGNIVDIATNLTKA